MRKPFLRREEWIALIVVAILLILFMNVGAIFQDDESHRFDRVHHGIGIGIIEDEPGSRKFGLFYLDDGRD